MGWIRADLDVGYRSVPDKVKFLYPVVQQYVNKAGAIGSMWVDSSGNWRFLGGSYPTNLNSSGTALATAVGANAALSNLASVAINTALLPVSTVGAIDIGSAAKAFRTAYLGTSLVFKATTRQLNVTASEPSTTRTVNFGDPGADDSVAYLAANQNLTTKTITSPTIAGTWDFAAVTPKMDAIAESTAAAGVTIDSVLLKDQEVTLGANGKRIIFTSASIGYIKASGNDLIFFDATNAAGYPSGISLSQLLGTSLVNPTITGDLTITDGKITWTDAVAEAAGIFSFAGTTTIDIAITSSITSGQCLKITADALTTGAAIMVDSDVAGMGAGFFFQAYDGAADAWTVGKYGANIIAGVAATDVFTITAGDAKHTAGDIRLSLGIIEIDNTADEGSYIKRNHASSTTAVLEIEQTNTANAGIGPCLLIDQNSTGNSYGIQIVHNGDYPAIDITADAARTGDAIKVTTTNFLANRGLLVTGASTGTSGQGMIEVAITGALAGNLLRLTSATGAPAATSSVAYLSSAGNIAAAIDGAVLQIVESGAAQATTYAVNISSTSNEALHVTVGKCLFSEAVSIATADAINQDTLTVTQSDSTNNKDAIVASTTGTGYVFKGTVATATGKGFAMFSVASQTTSLALFDGLTNNWIGANDIGMVHLICDGSLAHTGGTLLRTAFSGTAQNASEGVCAIFEDTSAAATTTAAVKIDSTNNIALRVTTGTVDLNGNLTVAGIAVLDGTPDTVTGAGACSIATSVTLIVSDAVPDALTLADGTAGQIKVITMITKGAGASTLTPTSKVGFTTVVFDAVGETVILQFVNTKWIVLGSQGATIA